MNLTSASGKISNNSGQSLFSYSFFLLFSLTNETCAKYGRANQKQLCQSAGCQSLDEFYTWDTNKQSLCISNPSPQATWITTTKRIKKDETSVLMASKLAKIRENCIDNKCITTAMNKPSYFKDKITDLSGGLVQLSLCEEGGIMSLGPTGNDINEAMIEYGKVNHLQFEIKISDSEVDVTVPNDNTEHLFAKVVGGAFDKAYLVKDTSDSTYSISRQAQAKRIQWEVQDVGLLQDTGRVKIGNTCVIVTPIQNKHPPFSNKKKKGESQSCNGVVEEAKTHNFVKLFSITQRARDCCAHLLEMNYIVQCSH